MTFKEWVSNKFEAFKKSKFYAKSKETTKKIAIKLGIILLILLAVYLLFLLVKPYLIQFLHNHPWINAVYEHIVMQITKKTYLGLFYASFFGAIFFITIPVELIIIYYISLGYNIIIIGLITTVASVLGLFVNYLIGLMLGKKIMKWILKDTYDKIKVWNDKYGGFFIFAGSFLPSPIEIACVIFGTTKYSIKKFFIYSTLGRILKTVALFFLADWLLTKVIPFFTHIF